MKINCLLFFSLLLAIISRLDSHFCHLQTIEEIFALKIYRDLGSKLHLENENSSSIKQDSCYSNYRFLDLEELKEKCFDHHKIFKYNGTHSKDLNRWKHYRESKQIIFAQVDLRGINLSLIVYTLGSHYRLISGPSERIHINLILNELLLSEVLILLNKQLLFYRIERCNLAYRNIIIFIYLLLAAILQLFLQYNNFSLELIWHSKIQIDDLILRKNPELMNYHQLHMLLVHLRHNHFQVSIRFYRVSLHHLLLKLITNYAKLSVTLQLLYYLIKQISHFNTKQQEYVLGMQQSTFSNLLYLLTIISGINFHKQALLFYSIRQSYCYFLSLIY